MACLAASDSRLTTSSGKWARRSQESKAKTRVWTRWIAERGGSEIRGMSKPSVMAISEDAVVVVDLMVVVGDDMLMMEAVMVEDDGCACC